MWMRVGGAIHYQLPSLLRAVTNPPVTTTMLYFYKKTERAIVCTDKVFGKKVKVTLENGNEIEVNAQVKFGIIAIGDQEIGEIEQGTKLPFTITDQRVKDKDGNETNLYWCTPE